MSSCAYFIRHKLELHFFCPYHLRINKFFVFSYSVVKVQVICFFRLVKIFELCISYLNTLYLPQIVQSFVLHSYRRSLPTISSYNVNLDCQLIFCLLFTFRYINALRFQSSVNATFIFRHSVVSFR